MVWGPSGAKISAPIGADVGLRQSIMYSMPAVPWSPVRVTLPVVCQPGSGAAVVSCAVVPEAVTAALQLGVEKAVNMEVHDGAACAGPNSPSPASRRGTRPYAPIRGSARSVI